VQKAQAWPLPSPAPRQKAKLVISTGGTKWPSHCRIPWDASDGGGCKVSREDLLLCRTGCGSFPNDPPRHDLRSWTLGSPLLGQFGGDTCSFAGLTSCPIDRGCSLLTFCRASYQNAYKKILEAIVVGFFLFCFPAVLGVNSGCQGACALPLNWDLHPSPTGLVLPLHSPTLKKVEETRIHCLDIKLVAKMKKVA
jgi:hypothetical protein